MKDINEWRVHPDFILAALFLISFTIGLVSFINVIGYPSAGTYFNYFRDIVSSAPVLILLLAATVFLLFLNHRSLKPTIIVVSVTVGLICIYNAYVIIIELRELYDHDLLVFIQGYITLIAAGLLLLNTLSFISGSKNTKILLICSATIVVMFFVVLVVTWRSGGSVIEELQSSIGDIPLYVALIINIMMITSKDMKMDSYINSIMGSITGISRSSIINDGICIERSAVRKLAAMDGSRLWCLRYEIFADSYYSEDYLIVLTRSRDGGTNVSFSAVENKSGMNRLGFHLRAVITDTGDPETCDTVRLYGDDGMFMQLIVSDGLGDTSRYLHRLKMIGVSRPETVVPGEAGNE